MPRPVGDFGYGKKFVQTPWNLMRTSQLEWFRDAERTPKLIRDKCIAELAWRTYELARMDALKAAQRPVDTEVRDDDIPM
jgi:hypothetical protein